MVRCQALTYKGRLISIVHRRVHGKMADPMEIVFDGDLVKTEFNEILLDYLEMKGILSDEDESSSGNDSDIGRAIIAENVGKRGRTAAPPATPIPPTATTCTVAVVGASTIIGLMPSSQITTLRVEMQLYSGWVNCYQSVF